MLFFSALKLRPEFVPSFGTYGRRGMSSGKKDQNDSTPKAAKTLTRQFGFDRSLSSESRFYTLSTEQVSNPTKAVEISKNPVRLVVAKSPSFTSYLEETDGTVVPKTFEEAKAQRTRVQRQRLLSTNSYRKHWRTSMVSWQAMAASVPRMAYAFDFFQKLG